MSVQASSRGIPWKPCVCSGLTKRIGRPVIGWVTTAGRAFSGYALSIRWSGSPLYSRTPAGPSGRPCNPDHAGEPLLHVPGQRVIGGPHVGEHRPALPGRAFLGMQDCEPRRLVFVRRVGVPIGCALDAKPIDVAVLVDIGQPRHFWILGVTIVDQRVKLRLAKAASERRQLARPQILLAEYQDGMIREGLFDPGQGSRIQRPRQVNAQRFSRERAVDRPKRRCLSYRLLLLRFDGPGSYIMVAASFVKDESEVLADVAPVPHRSALHFVTRDR